MTANLYRMFCLVEKQEGEGAPLRIIASTATNDRMGDIVDQTWLLDEFNANPVFLWGHNPTIPPIGQALNLKLEELEGKGPALTFEPKFDDGPHNPLAVTVAEQFRNRTLRAVSVGFRPGSVTPRASLDESHPKFASTGLIFAQNTLLEISAVTIPANAEALAIRAVGDPAEAIVARAVEQAEAIVKAALDKVPAMVADALKAALPAAVRAEVQGKEVRALIKGHLDAMPDDSGSTVVDWLGEAKDLEDSDNVTSIEEWLGKANQGAKV